MTPREVAQHHYRESLQAQPGDKERQTLDTTIVFCVAAAAELGWTEDRLIALRSEIAQCLNPSIEFKLPSDSGEILGTYQSGRYETDGDALAAAFRKVSEVIHPLDYHG